MKFKLSLLLSVMMSQFCFAAIETVSVGGNLLGGFNFFRQQNRVDSRDQFDMAGNLDFSASLNERWSLFLQLQGSPGDSSLSFPGPSPEITDINLRYESKDKPFIVTMGSFDTPFGRQTAYLSNNADTFENATLMNPLMYSMFAGPMGTLNTVGMLVESKRSIGTFTAALSNGTGESSANPDGGLEWVLGYTNEDDASRTSWGMSLMHSDDRNAAEVGFNSDFTGAIVDLHTSIGSLAFKSYVAYLNFDDHVSSTEDVVWSWMAEGTYRFPTYFLAGRISAWLPEDNNGDRSEGLPNPGLSITQASLSPVVDQAVYRYQLGLGYPIEDDIIFKTELFFDHYTQETAGTETSTRGLLSYINVRF